MLIHQSCRVATYCSSECMEKDWPFHVSECPIMSAKRAQFLSVEAERAMRNLNLSRAALVLASDKHRMAQENATKANCDAIDATKFLLGAQTAAREFGKGIYIKVDYDEWRGDPGMDPPPYGKHTIMELASGPSNEMSSLKLNL